MSDRVLEPVRPWATSGAAQGSPAGNGSAQRRTSTGRFAPSDPATVLGPLRAELEGSDAPDAAVGGTGLELDPTPPPMRYDLDPADFSTGWSEPTENGPGVGATPDPAAAPSDLAGGGDLAERGDFAERPGDSADPAADHDDLAQLADLADVAELTDSTTEQPEPIYWAEPPELT
ncbi:MAG: hypothetical protein QOC66_4206, partial [Pseudonocardiales bacterium]|nr:hypothetical protein [Pseudonocardiales bacterium]